MATTGADLIGVDQKGHLATLAGYGTTQSKLDRLSLWDEGHIPQAFRERIPSQWESEGKFTSVVPFFRGVSPIGGLILQSLSRMAPLDHDAYLVLSQIGAYYIESSGLASPTQSVAQNGQAEDLTLRQRDVLNHIGQGLTNAEIAKEMLLSESTIRQETVRIYRALAVGSRSEAAKKGRALGLIG